MSRCETVWWGTGGWPGNPCPSPHSGRPEPPGRGFRLVGFRELEQSPRISGPEDTQLVSDLRTRRAGKPRAFPLHGNPGCGVGFGGSAPGRGGSLPTVCSPSLGLMGKASKGLNTQVMAPESDTLPPPPHAAGTCACLNKCRVPHPHETVPREPPRGPRQGPRYPHRTTALFKAHQLKCAALFHTDRCQSTPSACENNRLWTRDCLTGLRTQ